MGKTTVSIPFITLRPLPDGGGYRPRYIPGPTHRRLGFRGEDLRHPTGDWFSLDEADAWSRARQRQVAQRLAATPRQRAAIMREAGSATVADLFDRWFKEPRMKGRSHIEGKKERQPLSAGTVAYYKAGAARIEELDGGRIWHSPAIAITGQILGNPDRGVLHRIEVERGLHVAICVRATLSAMFGWAAGKGLVPANPAKGLAYRMPTPPPRVRYGSIGEMRALVAAADAIGFPEIGDAIMLGLWTGQRQADRLALTDYQISADGIRFRQQKKRGQPLLIPASPELAARLQRMRFRRQGWKVNYPHVVLNERARSPFARDWYKHLFARVRAAAVAGVLDDGTIPDPPLTPEAAAERSWLVPPTPSLGDFHDQDLRDTAVTWLALSGASKFQIASITGHSLATIDTILKHYLGLHPELARSAIAGLVDWYEGQGEGT